MCWMRREFGANGTLSAGALCSQRPSTRGSIFEAAFMTVVKPGAPGGKWL